MKFSHCSLWTLPIILRAPLGMSPLLQLSVFNKGIDHVDLIGKLAKLPQVSANLLSI